MLQSDQVIEVRYAGIVIGQTTAVRDYSPTGVFVGISDPMPVGTMLSLKVGEQLTDGRVEQVVESADPTSAGMRIRFVDNRASVARPQTPPAAVTAAPAPAAAAPAPAVIAAAPAVAAAAAAPLSVEDSPSQASSGVVFDEGGEGESERIPAPPGLAGSGPDPYPGGGGGRRRRRRR